MTEEDRARFRAEARKYVEELYNQHRDDDVESWSRLIDILFLYVDTVIEHCVAACHDKE